MWVIKIIGFATGADCPHAGQYLRSFDFDTPDGLGYGEFTSDEQLAMRFVEPGAAAEFWRRQSSVRPIRRDGQANRPLTCTHIQIVRVPELTC